MKFTPKYKIILTILISLHFLFVFLTLSGKLSYLSNDLALTKGKGSDFFAVYQAGNNAKNGISIYLDNEGVSTPYSYPFRYLPFIAYTIGIPATLFKPFTAYYLWVAFYEFLLVLNIYLTYKLARNIKSFILASIPWLLFFPYFVEIFIGQWSYFLASLLFYTYYGYIKKNLSLYSYLFAPIVKQNSLILLPMLLCFKKYKLIIFSLALILITSAPYFLFRSDDLSIFFQNFKDVLNSHGGHFGLKALYYILTVKYVSLPLPRVWFGIFTVLIAIFLLALTFFKRKFLLSFALWICFYFFIYKDVWEHHYVLLIPIFSMIFLKYIQNWKNLFTRKNLLVLLSYILIASPTLFIFGRFFSNTWPSEPDTLNPLFVIIYHSIKIIGVFLLFLWCVRTTVNGNYFLKSKIS